MSNIITAQERKRLIRERRRSLQRTQTEAAADNDITSRYNEERVSKSRKLEALGDYVDTAETRDGVRLESILNECVDTDANSNVPQSLFSAVMSRSSNTPDDKRDGSLSEKVCVPNQEGNADDTKQGGVTFATTPIKSSSSRAVFDRTNYSPGRSPGGYDILKALDGVSDFTQTFYNMHQDDGDETDGEKQSQDDVGYRVARVITRATALRLNHNSLAVKEENGSRSFDTIIEETKMPSDSTSLDVSYYQEPIGINIMDWSLKKRVRILCSSGKLPGTFSPAFSDRRKSLPDEGLVQQLTTHFLSNNACPTKLFEDIYGRQPSLEESALAKWKAATMYYQHPAIHPLPLSVLESANSKSSKKHSLSSFNNRSTYQRVRLPGIGSMGGLGTSDKLHKNIAETKSTQSSSFVSSFPTLLDKRVCEWQESFSSIYKCWRSKSVLLVTRCSSACEYKTPPSTDEISRCCFYSIAPSQVILFRVGYTKDNKAVPMIIFSSTTNEFRSKVISMGASLRVLIQNKVTNDLTVTENLFTEDMLEQQPQTRPESQGEAADLRALREANNSSTDNRPTEVEVMQKKKVQSGNASSSIPPLYVVGNDDCDIVYEFLLNTCGCSVSGSFGNWQFQHDVPLLLCRSIGPCTNTVLKTLSVSASRDNSYWTQLHGQESQGGHNTESVMELYGPILPCSLRDLMCASINWMTVDQKLKESDAFDIPTQPMNQNGTTDSGNKVESHQISMFLQAHEGEFPISVCTSTGSASSYYFNGSAITLANHPDHKEKFQWIECTRGEGLSSLIWSTSHFAELSYNTFYAA